MINISAVEDMSYSNQTNDYRRDVNRCTCSPKSYRHEKESKAECHNPETVQYTQNVHFEAGEVTAEEVSSSNDPITDS